MERLSALTSRIIGLMTLNSTAQLSSVTRFRELHTNGCFVIPNPWDVGSAKFLQRLGFKALATTSAGFAFSQGLPDASSAITTAVMLEHIRQIAASTELPVSADFQDGYAKEPEGVAVNVSRCIQTGVAGLSIEDSTGDPVQPLYEQAVAVERIEAARASIDASGMPIVLTARCEAWLVGAPNAKRIAQERLVAYAEAGADCLYAPGVKALDDIKELARLVAPKALNALVSAPGLTVLMLEGVGVRRISVGSALARVAWKAFMEASRAIAEDGSFEAFAHAAPNAELNRMFREML